MDILTGKTIGDFSKPQNLTSSMRLEFLTKDFKIHGVKCLSEVQEEYSTGLTNVHVSVVYRLRFEAFAASLDY